jgi:hypothetical protein
MAELMNGEENKKNSKKSILVGITFVLLALIFSAKIYLDYDKKTKLATVDLVSFDREVLGQESGTSNNGSSKETALASSENFNATQISVNGGIGPSETLVDFEGGGLLSVSNVKSELYSVKDGDKSEVKAIISCQTNKKTSIEITYSKSGEKVAKVMKDVYYGLNHTLVIPALEADSVYRYSIKAKDPVGNIANSDQFVFYTGAPNISLMDVLGNATQKVFGWAMKK